jgi:hypothetical protein
MGGAIGSGIGQIAGGVKSMKDLFTGGHGAQGFDAPEGTFLGGDQKIADGIASASSASQPGFMDKYGKKMLGGALMGGAAGLAQPRQQQSGGASPIIAPQQPQIDLAPSDYLEQAKQRQQKANPFFGY